MYLCEDKDDGKLSLKWCEASALCCSMELPAPVVETWDSKLRRGVTRIHMQQPLKVLWWKFLRRVLVIADEGGKVVRAKRPFRLWECWRLEAEGWWRRQQATICPSTACPAITCPAIVCLARWSAIAWRRWLMTTRGCRWAGRRQLAVSLFGNTIGNMRNTYEHQRVSDTVSDGNIIISK